MKTSDFICILLRNWFTAMEIRYSNEFCNKFELEDMLRYPLLHTERLKGYDAYEALNLMIFSCPVDLAAAIQAAISGKEE